MFKLISKVYGSSQYYKHLNGAVPHVGSTEQFSSTQVTLYESSHCHGTFLTTYPNVLCSWMKDTHSNHIFQYALNISMFGSLLNLHVDFPIISTHYLLKPIWHPCCPQPRPGTQLLTLIWWLRSLFCTSHACSLLHSQDGGYLLLLLSVPCWGILNILPLSFCPAIDHQ